MGVLFLLSASWRQSVCVCVYVPFNISPPALPPLIPGLRFMILHYICPVTLIHPSHTDTCTHTRTATPLTPALGHAPMFGVLRHTLNPDLLISQCHLRSFSGWLQVPLVGTEGRTRLQRGNIQTFQSTVSCFLTLQFDWGDCERSEDVLGTSMV